MRLSDQRGERDSDVDATPEPGDAAGPDRSASKDTGDVSAAGAASVPARPAGKRSGARGAAPVLLGKGPAVSDGEDDLKAAKAKEGFVKRILRFLREVVAELRKVIWPDRKQTINYTIVVFVFLTFMVGLIFGLDQLFARGVLWLLG